MIEGKKEIGKNKDKLRKKEGKYQAFLMVPSAKLEDICNLKEVSVGG